MRANARQQKGAKIHIKRGSQRGESLANDVRLVECVCTLVMFHHLLSPPLGVPILVLHLRPLAAIVSVLLFPFGQFSHPLPSPPCSSFCTSGGSSKLQRPFSRPRQVLDLGQLVCAGPRGWSYFWRTRALLLNCLGSGGYFSACFESWVQLHEEGCFQNFCEIPYLY